MITPSYSRDVCFHSYFFTFTSYAVRQLLTRKTFVFFLLTCIRMSRDQSAVAGCIYNYVMNIHDLHIISANVVVLCTAHTSGIVCMSLRSRRFVTT